MATAAVDPFSIYQSSTDKSAAVDLSLPGPFGRGIYCAQRASDLQERAFRKTAHAQAQGGRGQEVFQLLVCQVLLGHCLDWDAKEAKRLRVEAALVHGIPWKGQVIRYDSVNVQVGHCALLPLARAWRCLSLALRPSADGGFPVPPPCRSAPPRHLTALARRSGRA